MDEKRFYIEKNVKDLEYNKTLNLMNAYAVIAATLIITVLFAWPISFYTKFAVVSATFITLFVGLSRLNRELDLKIKQIESLQ